MSRSTAAAIAASRGVRSLANIEDSASTARVLNLLAVAREFEDDPEYQAAPFFQAKPLNAAIFLKHRLRRDEIYLVESTRPITTKIIFPLNRHELGLGGQSILVGQRGWQETLRMACGVDAETFERDMATLSLLNDLPSFDPFLLREHLKRKGIEVATCYFALSSADVERMRAFVAQEVVQLIELAYAGASAIDLSHTAKLVSTLLSTKVDARLEPLRLTFGMDEAAFREGVFSWKGFLYYKWMVTDLRRPLASTLTELGKLEVVRPFDGDTLANIERARRRLRRDVSAEARKVAKALGVYDDAFRKLTVNGNPKAFREFLMRAPEMFVELGATMSGVSHIVSFWRYRFPAGVRLVASGPEAYDLLRDFEVSLGGKSELDRLPQLQVRSPRPVATEVRATAEVLPELGTAQTG